MSSPKSTVSPEFLGDRIATAIIRGFGYIEVALGFLALIYAGRGFYEKYTFAGVYWEGMRDTDTFMMLYSGVALLIAGGGIIWLKRWPFILHLPLVMWLIVLGSFLARIRS